MNQSLKIVFCGTPLFAVPTLKKMMDSGFRPHLVVTQPERASGRGLQRIASPIKQNAVALGLPVLQPDKIKHDETFRAQLTQLQPDAIIVVGYGRIIPPWMIDLPPLGNINLHASLLPKYRGAAPIQWAIARGEAVTGVTTMRIDAGLDTGDILLQRAEPIAPEDAAESLTTRLAAIGAELMVDTLHRLAEGTLQATPQDHTQATLAPMLTKEDGRIDFRRTALEIWNRLRGFQPWPGAYTSFRGKHFQVHSVKPLTTGPELEAGELLATGDRLLVGCGAGTCLELLEIQLEGKKRMAAREFMHGYHVRARERLG